MSINNFHPLKVWKSREVTDLLADFYKANFQKAGIDPKLGEKLVFFHWKNKGKMKNEDLMKQGLEMLEQAKKLAKKPPNEAEPLNLLDLSGVKTFLDIGANKLATINYFAEKRPNIKKLIGIDIVPLRGEFFNPKISEYRQIEPDAKSYPVADKSIDCVNIQFVFHHFKNLNAINRALSICKKILKPEGKIILWEESFAENADIESLAKENHAINIQTDKQLTEKFYNLSQAQRVEFIIANDWIINVGNPHMPWTGQYYSWNEWIKIMSKAGFELTAEYNFGLRVNGRLKQGVCMIGIFTKL